MSAPDTFTHDDAWRWLVALTLANSLTGEVVAAFIRGATQ